jgi:hypothetical protein
VDLDLRSRFPQILTVSIEGIKEAMHQEPFRPFTIRMPSGKEYPVDHPDFISASRSYRRLYVSTNQDDRVEMLDTLLVESLQYGQSAMGAQSA